MAGLSKSEAETIIRRQVHTRIQSEDSKRAIDEVISGVAQAIEENNRAIESTVKSMIDEKIRNIGRQL